MTIEHADADARHHLYAHIKDALDAPDVQERLRKAGVQPKIGRPEAVTEILAGKVAE